MVRAPFSTGWPVFASLAAAVSSFVGLPPVSRIAAHLRVGLAAGGLERVLAHDGGERLGLAPVSTFWPEWWKSGVPTICSRARSVRTCRDR
jgi:hypothetical protein